MCLQEPGLFFPQLRAIFRASAYGPVRLMLPMISNTQELMLILRHIELIKQQLGERSIPFDPHLPVGGMIEVPAAAINASMLCEYLDFLSIGTNDLIQYTLAIDRIDDNVNYLYDPFNPAVLKLIAMVLEAGERAGLPVTMCGEMAGDTQCTPLLLAMGLRNFSMHPKALAEVKQVILQTEVAPLQDQIKLLLACRTHDEYHAILSKITQLP